MTHAKKLALVYAATLAVVLSFVLAHAPAAAAQGANADYVPFPRARVRPFRMKRIELPCELRSGDPCEVAGVRLQEVEEGGAAAPAAREGADERGGRRLVFSGRDARGREWRVAAESAFSHYEALYEGDLDRNGRRDLVLVIYTGGNGLAPSTHLVFLTFDREGRPALLEATGHFDARPDRIADLADLDGDGRAELLHMVFDDGYWVTNVYRLTDGRWSRVGGRLAGVELPAYTRFTRRPNHRPTRPAPGRNPTAPDLLKRQSLNDER